MASGDQYLYGDLSDYSDMEDQQTEGSVCSDDSTKYESDISSDQHGDFDASDYNTLYILLLSNKFVCWLEICERKL